mgnify:CR=1 FL=1
MKKNKIIIVAILTTMSFLCSGQVYYGKGKFGKIEFVNDSVALLSFINMNDKIISTQVYYSGHNDTIFMSTKVEEPFNVFFSKTKIPINTGGWCVLTKNYIMLSQLKLGIEGCFGYYDTITKNVVFNDFFVKNGDILVFKDGPFYVRLKIHTNNYEERYFSIHPNGSSEDVIYLKKFPLLKKGNCLIPISKTLNYQCWVDNGFYFPKMKISKKDQEYKTIPIWSLGLRGLPYWNNLENGVGTEP